MIDTTNVLWYSSISVQFLFCVYLVWTRLAKGYPSLRGLSGCFGGSRRSARSISCEEPSGPVFLLAYTYYWLWLSP